MFSLRNVPIFKNVEEFKSYFVEKHAEERSPAKDISFDIGYYGTREKTDHLYKGTPKRGLFNCKHKLCHILVEATYAFPTKEFAKETSDCG